jgi:polysaccharide deacetylase family protein (PEP-CTERM system associated)
VEKHILTVDVEDNFTLEELADPTDWSRYEGQVMYNTDRVISLLDGYKAKATFFVVGAVAERHPEIVEYIIKKGHEVASHSYWHRPLGQMSMEEVERDIKMSAYLLSSISGQRVLGYRAMGFSAPEDDGTFCSLLQKHGYLYDSSRGHNNGISYETIRDGDVCRVYPSSLGFFGRKLVFSGGAYLRFLPLLLIERGFLVYGQKNQPVMIYIHPWEFNRDQPKRRLPLRQQLLQAPVTFTTERKLNYLLGRYNFVSIKEYLGI